MAVDDIDSVRIRNADMVGGNANNSAQSLVNLVDDLESFTTAAC